MLLDAVAQPRQEREGLLDEAEASSAPTENDASRTQVKR